MHCLSHFRNSYSRSLRNFLSITFEFHVSINNNLKREKQHTTLSTIYISVEPYFVWLKHQLERVLLLYNTTQTLGSMGRRRLSITAHGVKTSLSPSSPLANTDPVVIELSNILTIVYINHIYNYEIVNIYMIILIFESEQTSVLPRSCPSRR